MTTQVDLCNLALLRLGTRSTITALGDGSTEGNACGLIFPTFLNSIFSCYDWKFARIRVAPGTQASSRSEWSHEYPLPVDCVRLSSVALAGAAEPDLSPGQFYAGRVQFATGYSPTDGGGQVVWSNTAGLMVDYISNALTIGAWLPAFTEAFSWGLSAELAIALTSNGQIKERLDQQYQAMLQVAQDKDTSAAQVATQDNEPWVDVCNQALVMLGWMKTIRSVTDGTPEAAACAQLYPTVLNEVFGLYDWRFATARAALTAQANTRANEWRYEYLLPSDCVRVRRLVPPWRTQPAFRENRRLFDRPIQFSTGYSPTNAGQALWANETAWTSRVTGDVTPLYLEYTSNLPGVASWPPAIRSAVVTRLAALLALPIAKDPRLSQAMQSEFQVALQQATSGEASPSMATSDYVPDWIQVRRDCYDGEWGGWNG